jgi:hypothetical protein
MHQKMAAEHSTMRDDSQGSIGAMTSHRNQTQHLLRQIGVVLLSKRLCWFDHLECDQKESFSFKARDDLANLLNETSEYHAHARYEKHSPSGVQRHPVST